MKKKNLLYNYENIEKFGNSMKKKYLFMAVVLVTVSSLIACTSHYKKEEDKKENIVKSVEETKMEEAHKKLISNFYTAFQNGNAEEMGKQYHNEIEFEDPAFGKLKGQRAKSMWKMLTETSKGNIKINFGNIQVNGNTGTAEWDAIYKFSVTGRDVHNKIKANFEFKDGLIYKHRDDFDLWAWSRMAFGFTGWVLGYTPFFKSKLNDETNKKLTEYMSKNK